MLEVGLCSVLSSQTSSAKDVVAHNMGVIAMNAYHQQRKHFVPFLAIFTDITSVSKIFGQTGKIAENPYENQSHEWGNHD